MARTMRRIVMTCIALMLLAGAACAFLLAGGCSASASNPLAGARTAAVNSFIDSSGIKDRIESELYAHADALSERTGVPAATIEGAVESLAIDEWQAVELPQSASETATYAVNTDEVSATITTYDDPSVVTVEAYGQEVTLEIPASAQQYAYLLAYLQYFQ